MRYHYFVLLLFLLLLTVMLQAQGKLQFAQFAPNYHTPEFIGWHGGLQVNAHGGFVPKAALFTSQSSLLSVDGYLSRLKTGVGLVHFYQNSGTFKTHDLTLNVSPKIRLTKDLVFTPALSMRYRQRGFDTTGVRTMDPDPLLRDTTWHNLSGGFGLGFTFKDAFFASHFDSHKKVGLSPSIEGYYLFVSTVLGKNFHVSDHWMVTPIISHFLSTTFNYHLIQLACNVQYKGFYTGVSYRQNATVALVAGYELMERFRIGYSYQVNASRSLAGNHELTLRLLLFKDRWTKPFLSNLPLI